MAEKAFNNVKLDVAYDIPAAPAQSPSGSNISEMMGNIFGLLAALQKVATTTDNGLMPADDKKSLTDIWGTSKQFVESLKQVARFFSGSTPKNINSTMDLNNIDNGLFYISASSRPKNMPGPISLAGPNNAMTADYMYGNYLGIQCYAPYGNLALNGASQMRVNASIQQILFGGAAISSVPIIFMRAKAFSKLPAGPNDAGEQVWGTWSRLGAPKSDVSVHGRTIVTYNKDQTGPFVVYNTAQMLASTNPAATGYLVGSGGAYTLYMISADTVSGWQQAPGLGVRNGTVTAGQYLCEYWI